MTEVGEGIGADIIKYFSAKYLFAAITKVRFESGIDIYDVDAAGNDSAQLPPGADPHWGGIDIFPAVYVRQGGPGETKDVKLTVRWNQVGYDGSATIRGESSDGLMVIEGSLSISGILAEAVASCTFTKKPAVVKNYGVGSRFEWTITAGGTKFELSGARSLKLFFVDAKPKPVGWADPYKKHYLQVIDWTTEWAEGRSGPTDVFNALWDKFSDGTGPRVPHATGLSYWKTSSCAQNLKDVVRPGYAAGVGWSCRGIAHLFMECVALHGITCTEVIPQTDPQTKMFLVKNWKVNASPFNSPATLFPYTNMYYGGSWIQSADPPLSEAVFSTGLARSWTIDCEKTPGVSAQGQKQAPLGFSNHWIVLANGKLYDTSYGGAHADDINVYASDSLDGWLMGGVADTYQEGFWFWASTEQCMAWICVPLRPPMYPYVLQRSDGAHN